jgi:hypothetical protein
MQVGDLVWSLKYDNYNMGKVIERRLAIILVMDYDDSNPYIIKLVACGRQGRTSRKYLEPMGRD